MASTDDIRLPPKWIQLNIAKRECGAFIATTTDDMVCQCGRKKIDHEDYVKHLHHQETWNPAIHTRSFPTDSYGSVVFEGEHHPNKAHFVRLAYDTNPDLVWGLPMPKLLITIQGSNTNFDLPPRLGKVLQAGFIKAARSCSAWIFTAGFNDGVTKHIGTALSYDRNSVIKRGRSVVSVGIAPWGLVDHREELLVKNKEKVYNPLEHATSKFRVLNPKHKNFLLVDNGSVGKIGGETYFRRRLEKCIARHSTGPNRSCDIPVVCVVIEGGLFTLRAIGDYLHEDPPTPVVIVGQSGRTADLVAWVLKKAQQLPPNVEIEVLREDIFSAMVKMYHVNALQCVVLFAELKRILAKRTLVTVFNMHTNEEDFDSVLLGSIFRSQHWSPLQQLSLTLVWDRVDIAQSEVFVYGKEWCTEHLELAMMEALVFNRMDFVTLLLENGLNMQSFLTIARLESLYNVEYSSVLKLFLGELAKLKSKRRGILGYNSDVKLSMHDVGVAISHMMGHIYKSNYIHIISNASNSLSSVGLGLIGENEGKNMNLLYPFDDLFVWAVLTKRHRMALLLWRHGHGALVKSLVAIKLNKFIAQHFIEKSDANFAFDFQNYATEWENISYEVVDLCFKQDQKLARQLLTMELERWSKMTNLQLAVMANHRMLLGHPCSQILLADLWMGALNIKVHPTLKVLVGIVCPIYIFFLEYKSTEELKLLPHQERPMQQTRSRTGNYESLSDASSLRTFVSKSKSSLLGNIFHRRKSAVRRKAEEATATALQHSAHVAHQQLHPHEHGKEKEKPLPDNPSKLLHTVINADTDALIASEPLSVSSIYKRPGHQRRRPRSSFVTTRQSLPIWKKFYEFQKAPVTNFYRHALGYLIFVALLSYLILVPQSPDYMSAIEIYVVAYLVALGLEVFRDFLSIDALNWSQKLVEFKSHVWQIADFIGVSFFMVGLALRLTYFFDYGILIYRVSSIYWNLRLYKYMGVHRFLGPKIVMMSKMLKHMAYFAMIILVVVISFGIAREAIRFPNTHPSWHNIAEAFLEPYVMMFGEVDTDALSPQCGGGDQPPCPVGYWIVPITWAVYMMVANILIVNVLIAVFNGIYCEIDAISLQIWMFQRFNFVMEFEEKPLLPPPAMILCHVYEVLRWIFRKIKLCLCEQELDAELDDDEGPKIIMGNDHRLKTYLTPAEANIVFDFEENNMDLIGNRLPFGSLDDGSGDFAPSINQRYDSILITENIRDRQVQQIKNNFRDICSELESHREKLDRLLAYWEAEMEQEGRDSDSVDSEAPT